MKWDDLLRTSFSFRFNFEMRHFEYSEPTAGPYLSPSQLYNVYKIESLHFPFIDRTQSRNICAESNNSCNFCFIKMLLTACRRRRNKNDSMATSILNYSIMNWFVDVRNVYTVSYCAAFASSATYSIETWNRLQRIGKWMKRNQWTLWAIVLLSKYQKSRMEIRLTSDEHLSNYPQLVGL